MKLRVAGKRVEWDGGDLDLHLGVLEAIRLGERILVIHDFMAYPRHRPAPNLVAYTVSGDQLWTAENPTESSATDAYVGFLSEDPLWVSNFQGLACKIDAETGRLLASKFTK